MAWTIGVIDRLYSGERGIGLPRPIDFYLSSAPLPRTGFFAEPPSIKVRLPGIFTQVRAGSVAVNVELRRPTRNLHPAPVRGRLRRAAPEQAG
ncbi:MAG: hypothetical protein ACI89J_004512 [Hyphomicrobiaceae bacterium]|jgi:hypothetical protein